MSDVVFITPNIEGHIYDAMLGTLQLVTILEKAGIHCDVLPFFRIGHLDNMDAFLDSAMTAIQDKMPKIVSFYTRCDTYHVMLKMAQLIKNRFPGMYVVLGGPQSDITAEATVAQIPYVDFVCCGEGETTIVPFFTSLLADKPDTSIDGLVYRSGDEVIKNPRPALLKDLDSLPMLDYAFFQHQDDPAQLQSVPFPIDVGRGCPFGCTYCSTKSFWGRKFRIKSPERIVEEIQHIHDTFGVTYFGFTHDMFTMNRNMVIKTCSLLKQLDFPVRWRCSARLDMLDTELIDIMTDAGMKSIFIGIETGSPRMQKLINKNLDLSNAIPLISYLKTKDCFTTASFIYGFPEETEEDLSQTMRLIADLLALRTVLVQNHLCTFLSGTELSRRYISEMTKAEQRSNVTGDLFMDECSDLTDAHLDLFQHLLEYRTPLRTKLRHFPLFFKIWHHLQPVYQYLSEKYPADRLIDMYYDFVEANKDILDDVLELPITQWRNALAARDKFPATFQDDENYDLIDGVCRFRAAELAAKNNPNAESCEVYNFLPSDVHKKQRLQEYTRCLAIVRRCGGSATLEIYPNQSK